MKKFDDEEYFLLKALANGVVEGVIPALERLTKLCEKLVIEIEEIDKKLENAESGSEINEFSKFSQTKREELIKILAIKNRLDLLVSRNKSRVKYIDEILKNAGVYNEAFDRKKISEIEKQEAKNISAANLNLNMVEDEKEVESKFFEGEIIVLQDGELDFSLPENEKILISADDEFMSKLIKSYPSSMSTIGVRLLVNTTVKKRVLKTIATYVIDETKKKDIKQVNKELGNLLEFKTEITKTAEDYVAGVSNMFNVQVKKFMLENNPEKAAQINEKLKCNDKSELIPESKRIAMLAAGIMGDILPEAEESEEMRIAREKEMEQKNAINQINNGAAEQEAAEEVQMLEEVERIEEQMKLEEQEREIIKKQKKQEEQELEEQQAEEEMQRAFTRNKYDD